MKDDDYLFSKKRCDEFYRTVDTTGMSSFERRSLLNSFCVKKMVEEKLARGEELTEIDKVCLEQCEIIDECADLTAKLRNQNKE